jgi:anti-anti-sigma factor
MARLRRPIVAAGREGGAGSYRYTAAIDRWEWSDAIYDIHGFRRGDAIPSVELLLAHAHAGDRQNSERLIRGCMRDGKLFSNLYRLLDTSGQEHWVLIAGEGTFDAGGAVTGIRGYLIDLTAPLTRARSKEVARLLHKAADARATIEQAKGALMLVYGLDAQTAFALLSWHSQHANIKLRDLARRLVAGLAGDANPSVGFRARLDESIYSLQGTAPPASWLPAQSGETRTLTARRESADDAVVLHLAGDINMATGPRLDRYLAEAAAAAVPPASVVVDVSGITHLGSLGVALLTSYHRRCLAAGTPLRVVTGEGPALGILSAAGPGLDVHARAPDLRKIRELGS